MKQIIFVFAVLALILSACGTGKTVTPPPPTEESLPVITLDMEHMINPTLAYEIPAGAGFVLDASRFNFGTPNGPTSIQVVIDNHAFTGTWMTGELVQTVRAESLLPPAGFKPLTGFPAGKQMIVGVGHISDKGRFEPMWVAVVNVQ